MPNFFSKRWSCRTRSRRLSWGSGRFRVLTALLSSSSESFLVWRSVILAIVVLFLISCRGRSKPGNCHRLGRNEKKENQAAAHPQHPDQVKRQRPVSCPGHNDPRGERTKDAGTVAGSVHHPRNGADQMRVQL